MRTTRLRSGPTLVLLAGLALAAANPAAAFIRITRPGTTGVVQAHWLDTQLPLPSVINATNNDQPPGVALGIVQASAQAWQDVGTCYLTVNAHAFAGGPELPPALAFDAQNSMFFDLGGLNFPAGATVIAFVRTFVDVTDGHTLDSDLVFNDRDFYSSVSTPFLTPAPSGQFSVDLQSVLTHEYGHYFGLDHTSVGGSTMVPFIFANISQRTLELDDRAGISTIYAESAARGLSPGATDFAATTGAVSGTVVRPTGAAIFGAHVEAINLGAPSTANTVSAISGELTVRDRRGEFTIHGLPPGSYGIRIVPLDGVSTIAADANVGGIFNGLDLDFSIEFWNGPNEGPDATFDLPGDFTPVVVSAGDHVTGIDFTTNETPGQAEIAQYGRFENVVTRNNGAFLAVRFDPPFEPPYTIQRISFPSFAFAGSTALFSSVRLTGMNAAGLPDLAAPLFSVTPFGGSRDGVNNVPINLTVTAPNQTFFWVMQFPSGSITAPNYPTLRMDFADTERGLFANSYFLTSSGTVGSLLFDRNLIASMTCQLAPAGNAPIEAPSNLGANRRNSKVEFSYDVPPDARADGFPLPPNSLDHVDLLLRSPNAYVVAGSGGAGSNTISLNTISAGTQIWAAQAVDKFGHRSMQSNVTITGLSEDLDEPNGRGSTDESTPLTLPTVGRSETYSPAGDQDYFSLSARPGLLIEASAVAQGQDGSNNLDLIMVLLNQTGEIVALDDDSNGGLNPRLTYTVSPPSGHSNSQAPRKFHLLVTDFRHSLLSPTLGPRVVVPPTYTLNASATELAAALGRVTGEAEAVPELGENQFGFFNTGPNPARSTAKLVYVIPRGLAREVPVKLRIYDVNGRLVRALAEGDRAAGPHFAFWDGRDEHGRDVASGPYFARLETGNFNKNLRISLLR